MALTFLKGHEYRAALFQLPFAMKSAGIPNILIKTVVAMLEWYLHVIRPTFTVAGLEALTNAGARIQQTIEEAGLAGVDEDGHSGWNFEKNHEGESLEQNGTKKKRDKNDVISTSSGQVCLLCATF
jgi:hypothetical protein